MDNPKQKNTQPKEENTSKKRRIIIETDGDNIQLVEASVGGKIELVAILQLVINHVNSAAPAEKKD